MIDYKKEFISYAIECGVLKFGEFILKSGRVSPYFFNTALFNTGAKLAKLGEFYALALQELSIQPDMLYGPAYKGIPLVCATAIAYSRLTSIDIPFAFNRKENKDHGEGGILVGAPVQGRIVIVDDVISAGTSVRESVDILKQTDSTPIGVLIALDRQEKGQNQVSAIQEVKLQFGLQVTAIISLADIIKYLTPIAPEQVRAINSYQQLYGLDNGSFPQIQN